MTDASFSGGRYGLQASRRSLELRFDVRLETIGGVLTLAQEWAAGRGLSRDDRAGLRLLLEELLLNIRFHALPGQEEGEAENFFVIVRLEFVFSREGRDEEETAAEEDTANQAPDRLRIILRDPGEPFDPLRHAPAESLSLETAPGGRGLSLVRLFSVNRRYRREEGHNILSLEMPLGGAAGRAGANGESGGARPDGLPPAAGFRQKLRRAWREKLALRQTVLFTVSAAVLFWSGIGVYYATVATMRARNAELLAMQSMATQDELSRAFLKRVEGGLAAFARGLAAHPAAKGLLGDSAALLGVLRQGDFFRPFTTETPVIGIALGRAGRKEAWFFHLRDAAIVRSFLPDALAGMDPFSPGNAEPRWHGPVFHIPDSRTGRHAAMFFATPVEISGEAPEHWLGVVIGMPWIAETLRGISGFGSCVPVYCNERGQYVIYPPGRSAGQGPQGIFEDAADNGLPELVTLGRRMAAGEKGLLKFADGLETKGGEPVWPLPWKAPSTLIYYPMGMPGWRFALAVPSGEIGNTLPGLPLWLVLLAFLGPAFLGAVTWHVTSRSLRSLRDLAAALENLGDGDLDTPFPVARRDDETGRMLHAFERTRIILKTSFRNQVRGATAQQRMRNELALARAIQESMLPRLFPPCPGLDMAARMDMARDVCGDLYDCFLPDPARPDRVACLVGDVCGKGIPASLVMSRVMPLARSALLGGLSPAGALERINTAMLRQDASAMFVTMLIGIFDSVQGSFTWSCAGHPPPLPGPVPGEGATPGAPPWSDSLVLGVKPWVYGEQTLRLAPGQSLLLYTDGASEAMGPAAAGAGPGRPDSTEGFGIYGEDRLAAAFAAACRAAGAATPAAVVLEATMGDILAHMAGTPPFDDISLLVLKRMPEPS